MRNNNININNQNNNNNNNNNQQGPPPLPDTFNNCNAACGLIRPAPWSEFYNRQQNMMIMNEIMRSTHHFNPNNNETTMNQQQQQQLQQLQQPNCQTELSSLSTTSHQPTAFVPPGYVHMMVRPQMFPAHSAMHAINFGGAGDTAPLYRAEPPPGSMLLQNMFLVPVNQTAPIMESDLRSAQELYPPITGAPAVPHAWPDGRAPLQHEFFEHSRDNIGNLQGCWSPVFGSYVNVPVNQISNNQNGFTTTNGSQEAYPEAEDANNRPMVELMQPSCSSHSDVSSGEIVHSLRKENRKFQFKDKNGPRPVEPPAIELKTVLTYSEVVRNLAITYPLYSTAPPKVDIAEKRMAEPGSIEPTTRTASQNGEEQEQSQVDQQQETQNPLSEETTEQPRVETEQQKKKRLQKEQKQKEQDEQVKKEEEQAQKERNHIEFLHKKLMTDQMNQQKIQEQILKEQQRKDKLQKKLAFMAQKQKENLQKEEQPKELKLKDQGKESKRGLRKKEKKAKKAQIQAQKQQKLQQQQQHAAQAKSQKSRHVQHNKHSNNDATNKTVGNIGDKSSCPLPVIVNKKSVITTSSVVLTTTKPSCAVACMQVDPNVESPSTELQTNQDVDENQSDAVLLEKDLTSSTSSSSPSEPQETQPNKASIIIEQQSIDNKNDNDMESVQSVEQSSSIPVVEQLPSGQDGAIEQSSIVQTMEQSSNIESIKQSSSALSVEQPASETAITDSGKNNKRGKKRRNRRRRQRKTNSNRQRKEQHSCENNNLDRGSFIQTLWTVLKIGFQLALALFIILFYTIRNYFK